MNHDDVVVLMMAGICGMVSPRFGFMIMILYGVLTMISGHPVFGR